MTVLMMICSYLSPYVFLPQYLFLFVFFVLFIIITVIYHKSLKMINFDFLFFYNSIGLFFFSKIVNVFLLRGGGVWVYELYITAFLRWLNTFTSGIVNLIRTAGSFQFLKPLLRNAIVYFGGEKKKTQ